MERETAAKNRVALLTPPGVAAIAVVRIEGPDVISFLKDHFSAKLSANRCIHGVLADGDLVLDDPVVVTSGDLQTADINLHGGHWVVQAVIELAVRRGFERVEKLPDRMNYILEQEMLDALPLARTEEAIRNLLAQPALWAKPDRGGWAIETILKDHSLWWLLNPPKVAIVGAANVGKSTLANQLFGQARSITADMPGTTRDWVGDWASIDGLPVQLIDTPGLRDSKDAIEQAAITQSAGEIADADLILMVFDPTREFAPQQRLFENAAARAISIINKSDLPAIWDQNRIEAVSIVAISGSGIDELKHRIRERFVTETSVDNPRWWTTRQRDILAQAVHDPTAIAELF